jgi:hypothetical protein
MKLEYWNVGMLEYWNIGILEMTKIDTSVHKMEYQFDQPNDDELYRYII